MVRILLKLMLFSTILFSLEYGMIDNKIYKVNQNELLVTSDQGYSWDSKEFGSNILDRLVDDNQIILVLEDFTLYMSKDLENFRSIKLSLFENSEYIPDFSKISLSKNNGFYYLILKKSSSSNFNNGYVFKSENLENFKEVYSGDLDKYSLPNVRTRQSSNTSNIKKIEDNYCEEIDGNKECFVNQKIILIQNGEEIIIDEVNQNFDLSSSRSTRSINKHYEGQGFDKCEVATLSQLQNWWDKSPYRATNLYIGGNSRGCANSALNKNYIDKIKNIGWKTILTWVGPQATCSGYRNKIDSNNPYQDGVNQANLAINKVSSLGLKSFDGNGGGLIYYDLEQFTASGSCLNNSLAFMRGWSNTLRANNIKSGIYTSGSTIRNMTAISSYIDSVWVAHWFYGNYYRSNATATSSYVSNSWADDIIRQYAGDHNEKWGSNTLNIDSNVIKSKLFHKASSSNSARGIFDGAGSIIKPDVVGDGSNKDIASMHSHSPDNSTVVFQWKDSNYNCNHLDIKTTHGEDLGKVIVTTRGWKSPFPNTQEGEIFEVTLNKYPFSVKKATNSSGWTLISVTTKQPITSEPSGSKGIYITAECSQNSYKFKDINFLFKDDTYTNDNKLVDLTHGYWWTGNGSIISYNNRDVNSPKVTDTYGINHDSAITYSKHNSFTAFQWYQSDTCKKLKIGVQKNWVISNEILNVKEIKIKPWNAKDWATNTLCNNRLPCTISSSNLDGDTSYYIIKIKSNAGSIPDNDGKKYIKAECIK